MIAFSETKSPPEKGKIRPYLPFPVSLTKLGPMEFMAPSPSRVATNTILLINAGSVDRFSAKDEGVFKLMEEQGDTF
jgi:hypothetical protein